MTTSTALLTDRYELTMLEAALQDGTAERRASFEVYTRRLPGGRRYGLLAGTARVLDAVERFRFGDAELTWLRENRIVSEPTLDYLASFRFGGDIRGYAEGEVFFPGSPVLGIDGSFAEAVLLETVVLSILNHDSAIATAAARMVSAAGGRPLAEMGGRRTEEHAAVSAARAAWIAGFGATSNLEAGREWGLPTMGTAAHAFTLLHDDEEEAFRAQVATLGTGTTLLVDTYDIATGVERAVRVAGTGLGGVRIDSGDLRVVVAQVREQLDALGATGTTITVTNDLDENAIAALAASPVDSYGVGTQLVTGSGAPTMGMVYKLVAREDDAGRMVPVAKTAAHKVSVGGAKGAVRVYDAAGVARVEELTVGAAVGGPGRRPLQVPLVVAGVTVPEHAGLAGTIQARARAAESIAELPIQAFSLGAGDPVIPTTYA